MRLFADQAGYEVVRSAGGDSESVFQFDYRGAPDPSLPGDVTIDPATGTILYALCCEAAGTILAVDDPDHMLSDQGHRVDLLAGAGLAVRADTSGGIGIRPEFPEWTDTTGFAGAQAVDVVATPDGRVVALIDPIRLINPVVIDNNAPATPGLLVLQRQADCHWAQEHIDLDASAYCSLVALDQGRVGLLTASSGWRPESHEPCHGDTLDVLNLSTGEVDRGVLTFPTALIHLSNDGSGRYLIATGVDGRVWWRTLDGDGGQLPGTSYVAADW